MGGVITGTSMNSNTEYNPADDGKPFNASVNFCSSQHQVQPSEREAALDLLQKLVDHTKATIQDHE
jgi:hypothetical protein